MWHAASLDASRHGFSGVADGDVRPGPEAAAVGARLAARLGGAGRLVTVSQVHGAAVIDAADVGPGAEADALVSDRPGVVIAVRVADCVPILLDGPGVVAAIHAGWRGTVADIVRRTLTVLRERHGVPPEALRAAIGPAICGDCYEVSPEVVEAVGRVAPGTAWQRRPRHVDLRAANAAILAEHGVACEVVGPCTRCGGGLWSHRRDGAAAGRQVGMIRR